MTRVGVTGHQQLDDPASWAWVRTATDEELATMAPPLVAITALAIGADQLVARLVLRRGGKIHAVLPYADIERSFSPEAVSAFRELAQQASVEVLESPGTDEDAYLAAGYRVVDLSDVVIAVWNGRPAKGKGGTADIVAYALRKMVPIIHINPVARTVQKKLPGS
jgi:hypothetical protein